MYPFFQKTDSIVGQLFLLLLQSADLQLEPSGSAGLSCETIAGWDKLAQCRVARLG